MVSAIARELQFRANFFAKIVQNALWVCFYAVVLLVVFANTKSVAGWNQGDAFVLAGTVVMLETLTRMFFNGLTELPEQVRRGSLDFIVTRPVDSQFWVSMRRFYFDQAGPFVAGCVMIWLGLRLAHVHPSGLNWLLWFVHVALAQAIFYSFNLILMTTSIWLVRVDNLFVLSEMATQIARNPLDIYNLGIRRLMLYALPLAFLGTVPARALLGQIDPRRILLAFFWAAAALVAARLFWRFATRSYTSASS